MKSFNVKILLVAGVLSGCSTNIVNESVVSTESLNLIGINVASGVTKAADTTTSVLENDGDGEVTMAIYGTPNGEDQDEVKYLEFEYAESGWEQSGSESISWDYFAFPISLFSLHDGTLPRSFDSVDAASAKLTFTTSLDSADQMDLVYYGAILNATPLGGKVSAFFNHALSKIDIYAGVGECVAYIAAVNLVNVADSEELTIGVVSSSASPTISWSGDDSQESAFLYYDDLGTFVVSDGGDSPMIASEDTTPSIMMIPQELTATSKEDIIDDLSDSYIEVIYRLEDSEGASIVGYQSASQHPLSDSFDESVDLDEPLYVKVAFPLGYDFESGMAYRITIGLGLLGSTGGLNLMEGYVDGAGDLIDLGVEDTLLPDVGDPIFPSSSSEISVSITVNEWSESSDSDVEAL